MVSIRRVTKVVKGGKKTSFRALLVIGNDNGKVGVGVGKASDSLSAIRKGVIDGKKNMITVPLTSSNSIPHQAHAQFCGAKLMLKPAAVGAGVVAGGATRIVLESAGIRNVLSKQLGSSNLLNNAKAAVLGLKSLRSFREYV